MYVFRNTLESQTGVFTPESDTHPSTFFMTSNPLGVVTLDGQTWVEGPGSNDRDKPVETRVGQVVSGPWTEEGPGVVSECAPITSS